jgi:hypothetical protein
LEAPSNTEDLYLTDIFSFLPLVAAFFFDRTAGFYGICTCVCAFIFFLVKGIFSQSYQDHSPGPKVWQEGEL